jgi:hypothetical protein
MFIRLELFNRNNMGKWVVPAAVALMAFVLCAPVAADRPAALRRQPVSENPHPAPVHRVTIEKKMIDAVVTSTGDTYAIDSRTIIVEPAGSQVSIRQLPVPCDAALTVEKRKGVPTAQRIQVVRAHANARWQWTGRQPE